MFRDKTSKALAIVLSCVIATVCLGTLYFVGNLARFQEAHIARESQAALRSVHDPAQLDLLVKQYPSNRVLKLVGLANRDAIEIEAATRSLLNEADPGELWKRMQSGVSGRADLEALARDLKTAESNAAALETRYEALSKAARDKVEHDASAEAGQDDMLARFMAMIDAQHAAVKAVVSRIAAARLDYFGAYQKCVALLIREFGATRVVNGQYIFPLQPQADSYNGAAAAMADAARRLAELETERTGLRRSQLDEWKSFADQA
jgi:hypothetical protein